MNEQDVGFSVKARVLPQIEGLNQFIDELADLSNKTNERVRQVTSGSNPLTDTMTPMQLGKIKEIVKDVDNGGMREMNRYETSLDMLSDEMERDADTGLTGSTQMRKYMRSLDKQKRNAASVRDKYISTITDPEAGISPDQQKFLIRAINEEYDGTVDRLDKMREKFVQMNSEMKKGGEQAKTLFDQLKSLGVTAMAGAVIDETLSYVRTGAEIEAKQRTSFDFSSPIAMYQARGEADLFQETRERERDYSLAGMIVGGIGAVLLTAATGGTALPILLGAGVAGMYAGSSYGAKIAGIKNIEETADWQEQMKMIGQGYGTIGGIVNQTAQYDILEARTRAKLGPGALEYSYLGYGQEAEMQMKMSFADAYGRYDKDRWMEQTTFARAEGLDPSQLYQLNTSARMTGQDTSILGLVQSKQISDQIFGKEASPSRMIEILQEIKKVNEDMLKHNVDADAKDAMTMVSAPESLFGISNPYGRLGDLRGETIKLLTELMKPKSGAHEAFLYTAMGMDGDLMGYSELKKGGIYKDGNLQKILEGLGKFTGGSELLNYFALNEMIPNAPAGFLPTLSKLTSGQSVDIERRAIESVDEKTGEIKFKKDAEGKDVIEKVSMTLEKFFQEQERYKPLTKKQEEGLTEQERNERGKALTESLLGNYKELADKAKSTTESMMEEIKAAQVETARGWRETIKEVEVKTAQFWTTMGQSAEMHKQILGALEIGFLAFDKMRRKLGIFTSEEMKFVKEHESELRKKIDKGGHISDEKLGSSGGFLLQWSTATQLNPGGAYKGEKTNISEEEALKLMMEEAEKMEGFPNAVNFKQQTKEAIDSQNKQDKQNSRKEKKEETKKSEKSEKKDKYDESQSSVNFNFDEFERVVNKFDTSVEKLLNSSYSGIANSQIG